MTPAMPAPLKPPSTVAWRRASSAPTHLRSSSTRRKRRVRRQGVGESGYSCRSDDDRTPRVSGHAAWPLIVVAELGYSALSGHAICGVPRMTIDLFRNGRLGPSLHLCPRNSTPAGLEADFEVRGR